MSALTDHIKALNAKTREWVNAAPGRGAGMLTEDEAHWNGYGVYTPEQFDRYMMEAEYSDLYKEVHGIRPRRSLSGVSDEELKTMLAMLEVTCDA